MYNPKSGRWQLVFFTLIFFDFSLLLGLFVILQKEATLPALVSPNLVLSYFSLKNLGVGRVRRASSFLHIPTNAYAQGTIYYLISQQPFLSEPPCQRLP